MTPLPAPRLFTAPAVGEVFDHGAHVTSWIPKGSAEVLFLSSRAVFDTDAAIRGGVPICFPWFGPGRTGDQRPAHGFARLSTWSLRSQEVGPEGIDITYALEPSLVVDAFAVPAFRAEYRIHFGMTLELELTVENTGSQDFTFEEALHAYLAVGDIGRVRIEGLDGAAFIDQALGGVESVQSGDIAFTSETDRIYRSAGEVTVVDPVLDRRIHVTRTGSADVVIWNPWDTKGAALADLGDGQWRDFVCVEGANTRDAAITLRPGERHCLGYSLRIG